MMRAGRMVQSNMFPVTQAVANRLTVPAQTISTNQRIELTGMGIAGISQIMLRVICSVSRVCFILVVTRLI